MAPRYWKIPSSSLGKKNWIPHSRLRRSREILFFLPRDLEGIFQYLLTISKPLYQCMRFEVKQVTKYKSHTLINVSGLYGVNLIFLLSRWPYIADYLDSWKTIIYFSYHYNAKYVTPGTLWFIFLIFTMAQSHHVKKWGWDISPTWRRRR